MLPTHARAVVNFRILPGDSIAGVLEHVRQTINDPRVQLRSMGREISEPSPISDTNSPGFEVLQQTIRQVFPDKQLLDIADDDMLYQLPYGFPNGAPAFWHHGGRRAMGLKTETFGSVVGLASWISQT